MQKVITQTKDHLSVVIGISATVNRLVRWGSATSAYVSTSMGDRNSMSISADRPSDDTLN